MSDMTAGEAKFWSLAEPLLAGLAAVTGSEAHVPLLDRALRLPQPWTFDRY